MKQGLSGRKETKVIQAILVQKDHRVKQEQQVQPDPLDRKEKLGLKDRKDLLD